MIKRLLFLLVALLTLGTLMAQRYDFSATCSTGQTLYYKIIDPDNHYVSVVSPNDDYDASWSGYNKPTGNLVIPSSVQNNGTSYSVTRLGHCVFYGCSGLTSVSMPNSVTGMENWSFAQCTSLSVIQLSNNLQDVGGELFNETPWWSNQPDGEIYIGTVFYGWKGYMPPNTTINVAQGTTIIRNSALHSQANLVAITLPNSLVNIDQWCLYGTSVSSITLPNSVTHLGAGCFGKTQIASITIPSSVETIEWPFWESDVFQNYNVDPGNTHFSSIDGMLCSKDGAALIYYPNGRSGEVTLPSSVTRFNQYETFATCHHITSINIPASIESFGEDNWFRECSRLESLNVDLGNPYYASVNGILYNKQATRLIACPSNYQGTVSIPNTVTRLMNGAFWHSSIKSLIIPNSVDTIGGGCFEGSRLEMVVLPQNLRRLESCTFRACVNLREIIIPDSVTYLEDWSIMECGSLEHIVFGASVSEINSDRYMFSYSFVRNIEFKNPIPPFFSGENVEMFTDETLNGAIVKVPCGSANAYHAAPVWSEFRHVYEDMIPSFQSSVADTCFGMGQVVLNRNFSCTNDTVTIVASPFSGYHFTNWTDGNTSASRTILMSDTNTYLANFAINHYDVAIAANNEVYGSIDQTVSGNYAHGTQFTITATPAEGCYFAGWSDGNMLNPRTFTATDDMSITANFDLIHYAVSAIVNQWHMGSVHGIGSYIAGDTVTLTAVPNEGYHFTGWSDGETTDTRTVVVPGHDTLFTANFAINRYTFAAASIDNTKGIVINYNNGTYDHGTQVHVQARAFNGYHFTSWSDGNTDADRYLTLTGDSSLFATFEINTYTITVRANDDGLGTVTGGGTFTFGDTYTISATPAAAGIRFSYWSDGNNENPRTVMANGNVEWVAFFEYEQYSINVSSMDENKGFAIGSVENLPYGTQVTISAFPQPGYYFNYWSDGSTENPHTVTATSSRNYIAFFSENQHVDIPIYDFAATVPTGQLMYFKILDTLNRYVELVHPGVQDYNLWVDHWNGYQKPSGNLTIPQTVQHENITYHIIRLGAYALTFCDQLTNITIEAQVDTIKEYCFFGSTIHSIVLPESLLYVRSSAFSSDSLRTLHIPSNVHFIDSWAQGGWNFDSITVDPNNQTYCAVDNVLYSKDTTMIALLPTGKTGRYVMPQQVSSMQDWNSIYATSLSEIVYNDRLSNMPTLYIPGRNISRIEVGRNMNNINGDFTQESSVDTLVFRRNDPPTEYYNLHRFSNTHVIVPCGSRTNYLNNGWSSVAPNVVASSNPTEVSNVVVIEYGDTYQFWDTSYTQRGIYSKLFRSVAENCDSIRYELTLNVERHNYIDTTIYAGGTYVNEGIQTSAPGVFVDTITTGNYDSLVVARVSMIGNSGNPFPVTLVSNVDDVYWIEITGDSMAYLGNTPEVLVDPMDTRSFAFFSRGKNPIGISSDGSLTFTPNMFINGNLELGNTGFQTGYSFCETCWAGSGQNNLGICDCGVNGSKGMGLDGAPDMRSIFEQNVNLIPGHTYRISWKVKNIATPVPRIAVKVNGTQVGTTGIGSTNDEWMPYSVEFIPQIANNTISFVDVETDINGNDFYMDEFELHDMTPNIIVDTITVTNRHQIYYSSEDHTIHQGERYNDHSVAGIYFNTTSTQDYDSVMVTRLSMVVNNSDATAVPLVYGQPAFSVVWKCLEDSTALSNDAVAVPPMHTYHCVAITSMRSDTIAVTNRHQYILDSIPLCHTSESYLNTTIDSVGNYIFAQNADTSILLTVFDGWRYTHRYEDVMACAFPYTYEDQTWSQPGTYTYRHTSANRCDSIVTITLTPKEVLLVDIHATGANNGSSWADAYTSLQAAVDASYLRQDKPDVWVASGTYKGDSVYYHNAFVMKNHVNVYGGFAGTECSLTERQLSDLDGNGKVESWEFAHATILDGQHVQRVLYQNEDSWDDTTTWDGFTIQNARLTYPDEGSNAHGAGVYMRNNGRIRNCIVQNNDIVVSGIGYGAGTRGGFVETSAIRYNGLEGSTSGENQRLDGAGVESATLVSNSSIYGNLGYWGAGACRSTAMNCLIFDNEGGDGAGVSECTVYNSIIKNNTGSGVRYSTIYNCVVTGNTIAAAWDHWIYNSVVLGEIYPGYTIFNSAILGGVDATYNIVVSADNDGSEPNTNYVRFVDPEHNDYRLLPGSSLINTGNNDFRGALSPDKDYYGYDRVISDTIDIGVAEYKPMPIIYDTIDLCHGSISYRGTSISEGGRYIFHLHEFVENDTLLLVQANSHKSYTQEEIIAAPCALPYSYSGADAVWTSGGNYIVVYTDSSRCDSIVKVNLQIKDVLFVRPTAFGNGDGSNWENAMGNLQNALDTAYWRSPKPMVWVSNGTYHGDSIYYHSAFTMREGVDVYGGFLPEGCSTESRIKADIDSNGIVEPWEFLYPSILDGQHVQRVLEQPLDFGTTTVWEGLTLQNANLIYTPKTGGGALLRNNGELRKCQILNNRIASGEAGGAGVYSGVVRESLLKGNGYTGSEWYSFGGASQYSTLYSCKLINNFAYYGGGGAMNATLYNCIIANNDADRGGGTEYSNAYNCVYYNNTSNWNFNTVLGGNIYNSILIGEGAYQEESHLYNCAIYGTTAYGANNITLDTSNDGFATNVNYARFVDPEHGDFRLLPGSACINHGSADLYGQSNADCPASDFYGGKRLIGTLDIGVAEYSGAPVIVDTVINCHADYDFFGDTIFMAGRYYHQDAVGYHIVELHNKPVYKHIDWVNLCDNAGTYSYGDSTFAVGLQSSTHDVHFSTIDNCDSTIMLTLNVHPTFNVADTLVLCDNMLPYLHNGNSLSVAGYYSVILYSAHQCDSSVATTLIVNPSYQHADSAVICQSQLPFTYADTIFDIATNSGLKGVHLASVNNCDSVINLNLTVNPIYHHFINAVACDNQLPYQYEDSSYSIAGSYDHPHTTLQSCDSLVSFTLTVNSTYHHYDSVVICDNALPYSYGDSLLSVAGTGNVMFSSSANCDSLMTVNLTVHPSYQHTDTAVLCQNGLPYTYGTSLFDANTVTGNYPVRFASINNCDSIIQLAITVNPIYHHYLADTICDNMLPYSFDGENYGAGVHDILYQSVDNCDSTLTFSLTVNNTFAHTDTMVICDNLLPYSYGDSLLTASGIYNIGFSTIEGCDSTVALRFTANSTFHHNDHVRICESTLPYLYGDSIFYEDARSSMYTIPFVSRDGCDSIIQLDLTVNPSPDQSICMVTVNNHNQNQVVWAKGEPVLHYNIYREGDITGNFELMDSVGYHAVSTWTDTASNALTRAYSYKISAVDSCGFESEQSLLHHTMHLTISPGVNNSTWNLVWTKYEGAEYSNYKIYRGYTNGELEQIASIPTTSTSYTDQTAQGSILYYQVAIVLDEPCSPSKDATSIIKSNIATNNTESITDTKNDFDMKLYPNPTSGVLQLWLDELSNESVDMVIYDLQGKVIWSRKGATEATVVIDITDHPSGSYFLRVTTADGQMATRKVIKR